MGHITEPAGAVVVGCKVLPIFNEKGIDSAMKKMVHRIDGKIKAVARVKELLKRAAHAKPQNVSAKKWKKVMSFQHRDTATATSKVEKQPSDDMSSTSSKLSFKWDVGSCSSAASSVLYSPLSFASAPAKTTRDHIHIHTPSRNLSRLSSSGSGLFDDEVEQQQHRLMGQWNWITTDSDFVVLEL